ncbi:MAG: hypothetical protein HN353_10905 [Bdellovibrionales bacterium]|jgi:hypothetical protein|nr:hypothetical protein [Bdellovibrionales bacterium]MBT3524804.1 hypothetical protein [Bdellovibrionales bacterium]MBT7669746.1 hypothetical protein [Bdellovibrionales bacterium]MBT7767228.1 hypothetical protein [Bdellovibrionales bacterium]
MSEESKLLEEMILKTVSFYEPMTIQAIILDLDPAGCSEFPQLTTEELKECLLRLNKRGVVKIIKGSEISYLRVLAKQGSWVRRLLAKILP